MIRQVIVIARKEIVDHSREMRAVGASAMHLLMGPLVILVISFSRAMSPGAKSAAVLAGMMSIFVLVAAFVGGMNIAMDVMAGERERQSLLPLLMNPVSRLTVIVGKWLAISLFSVLGVASTLASFAIVCEARRLPTPLFHRPALLCWAVLGMIPLAFLAAALQLAISTACRTAKEAHTYLSLLIFIPMGIAMFLLFLPGKLGPWVDFVPVAGQQAIAELGMTTGHWPFAQALTLALATAWLTSIIVIVAGKMLERDSIVYGR
jgi:sodium transport system permease protein